jgi:hypothetical protein
LITPYTVTDFLRDQRLVYRVSDPREYLTRFDDRCHIEVGGFNDTVGTHFSRLKDEGQYIQVGEHFFVTAEIDLPLDFYAKQYSSLKLITCGSESIYRRMGLWIDSAGLPRLQAETKGKLLKVLWKGTKRIPVGYNVIKVEFIPSPVDGQALTRLYLNGTIWAESTKGNFIAGGTGYLVNRIVWGFDGAAGQDLSRIAMDIYSVGVEIPTDPCPELLAEKAELERTINAYSVQLQSLIMQAETVTGNIASAQADLSAVELRILQEGC